MKKHLSWWQTALSTKLPVRSWAKYKRMFERNCGSFSWPFKEATRKHIADMDYKSVLDCGAGLCSEYYGFKNDGYSIEYHAIDITPLLVEKGQLEGIDIQIGDLSNLPFEDDSVDVCICMDTLNHQLSFEEPINEMLRVASKEVIISFFKNFSEDGRIKKRCFAGKECTLIYNFFNKQKLIKYLVEKGVDFRFEKYKHPLLFITKRRTYEVGE